MATPVRFAEVRKMLESAGYSLVRVRGSHHVFAKPEELPLSIPVRKSEGILCPTIEKLIAGDDA